MKIDFVSNFRSDFIDIFCFLFSVSSIWNYLGFAHSAVSPILHWVLNYNSLRQSACQPFAKLNSAQRFLRSHLRFTGPPPAPPSSTNEAALGPFNPRFIKQRPQVHKPPASSHYLYWASAIHIKVKYIFNIKKGKKGAVDDEMRIIRNNNNL